MNIGILSDIHGDARSLQKAISLFSKLGVSRIVCAGDVVEKGPSDDQVAEFINDSDMFVVQGNHDANAIKHHELSKVQKVRGEVPLRTETIRYLRTLPATLEIRFDEIGFLLTHAIPSHNAGSVFHENGTERLSKRFKKDLARTSMNTVVVGHTHFPFDIRFKEKRIINPGATCKLKYRDSHTAGVLDSRSGQFIVYELENEARSDILRKMVS